MHQAYLHRPDSAPKVITEPTVTLLAATELSYPGGEIDQPLFGGPSFTGFDHMEHPDGEYLIEFGGRACYQSFHNPAGRTTGEYIRNIISQKHFSVLEHANVSFYIEGVSRSFTHELIRHRHLSYSQLSQRYVDQTNASYVAPPLVSQDPTLFTEWCRTIDRQHADMVEFQKLIDARYPDLPVKKRREAARSLAPNAIETKILVTGNLRAWREYLEKRWNSHAEAEIQQVSRIIRDKLHELYPSCFEDIAYA